jgi:hypothetical protein
MSDNKVQLATVSLGARLMDINYRLSIAVGNAMRLADLVGYRDAQGDNCPAKLAASPSHLTVAGECQMSLLQLESALSVLSEYLGNVEPILKPINSLYSNT